MRNQYKRQDIFVCAHDAHRNRGHTVSVYHTLHRKECFPHGCTYFRPKCVELEKRRKCYRGYTHVGKKCEGCRFFDEEKLTRVLLKTDADGFDNFVEDLHDFEEWLRDHIRKRHACLAKIRSVKPRIKMFGDPEDKPSVHLSGYLLCLQDVFIGNEKMEDYVFAVVSRDMQRRLCFRQGDEVDFEAELASDEGRLLLNQWRKIDFRFRSQEGVLWTDSDSLVARSTGRLLKHQAAKCIACEQGMLVDVVQRRFGMERLFHRIYCLLGMPSAAACTYDPGSDLYAETCSNRRLA